MATPTLSYKAGKKLETLTGSIPDDVDDIILDIKFGLWEMQHFLGYSFNIQADVNRFSVGGIFKKEVVQESLSVYNDYHGIVFTLVRLSPTQFVDVTFHFQYWGIIEFSPDGSYGMKFSFRQSFTTTHGYYHAMWVNNESLKDEILFKRRGVHVEELVLPLLQVQWGSDRMIMLPEEVDSIKEKGFSLIEGEDE